MALILLTLVLGLWMERSVRQTPTAEQGNRMALVERLLSASFIAISVLLFALALLKHVKR